MKVEINMVAMTEFIWWEQSSACTLLSTFIDVHQQLEAWRNWKLIMAINHQFRDLSRFGLSGFSLVIWEPKMIPERNFNIKWWFFKISTEVSPSGSWVTGSFPHENTSSHKILIFSGASGINLFDAPLSSPELATGSSSKSKPMIDPQIGNVCNGVSGCIFGCSCYTQSWSPHLLLINLLILELSRNSPTNTK